MRRLAERTYAEAMRDAQSPLDRELGGRAQGIASPPVTSSSLGVDAGDELVGEGRVADDVEVADRDTGVERE